MLSNTLSMQLSKNFTLSELIEAGSARRLGLDEQFNPDQKIIDALRALCVNVLQPLRDAVGKPIRINSGYRSPKVNEAVGGSKTSDHMFGRAADIELWIDGVNKNQLLFDKIVELGLPFKQMIDEFGSESEPAWIHVSYDCNNVKREKLRARKVNGKTIYTLIK